MSSRAKDCGVNLEGEELSAAPSRWQVLQLSKQKTWLAPGPVNLLAPRQAQKTMYLVSLVVPTEGKVGRTQDLCEKCWKDSHVGNAERKPSELNKRSDGGVQNNLFGDRWLERLFCVKFVEATKELRSDPKGEERQCWVRYMYMVWKQM